MTIMYGSLCTGYDGMGQALRLAGVPIEPRWMAENDTAMSEVLKHEHPDVRNAGDIKTAPWWIAPTVDLMSSGDPCQSISVAGRQLGRDDPRFLWPWVRDAYLSVAPGGIFFENVANIVSHDGGRTLAERLAHLRQDGYAVRWTVLGACSVGAPHHRHRWYAVAGYVGAGAPEAVRIGKKAICGAPRSGGRVLLPSPMARDASGRGEGTPEYWERKGEARLNRAPLGAAVIMLPTPMADRSGSNRGGSAGRGEDQPIRPSLDSLGADTGTWGRYAEAIELWEQVTGIPAPEPTEVTVKGSRRLSAALPEWMMGLRPGLLTDRLGRADALKGAGNGVVPLAAAAAWKLLTA